MRHRRGLYRAIKGDEDTTGAFALGMVLGPIGVIIVLIRKPVALPEWTKQCPAKDAAGVQCVLPGGHREPHTIVPAAAAAVGWAQPEQCAAVHPGGSRCVKPAGHVGDHVAAPA